MSALAPQNSYRIADEQGWLESSDNVELSPATVWAYDDDEEDETTLQRNRVATKQVELMSPDIDGESWVVERPRQVRILDESQVLPGEASFATVSLNQPFEESALKTQESRVPISNSIDDHRERSVSRVRVLDESWVPDSEASFATARSGERSKAHSPITEFLVKTKLSSKQLVLAMLAVVSVLALAVIVLLGVTRSEVLKGSSAPPPASVDTATQPASTSASTSTEAPKSVLILNSQGGVSGSAIPDQAETIVEATPDVAEAKSLERSNSEDSRKAPASDAKSGAVRQETRREISAAGARVSLPKERVTESKRQPALSVANKVVKERASVSTPTASVRSEPRPEPATRKAEAPAAVENVETKAPAATGGGTRPRTVTRKP